MIFLRRESRTEIPKWGWYMIITEISHRTPALLEQLLEIWERSVRATHTFLSEAEILRIREYVPCALSQTPCLVTAELTPCRPVAFMGLDRENLEMLFVAPEARGQGDWGTAGPLGNRDIQSQPGGCQ
jgi:putative acetyltransferase